MTARVLVGDCRDVLTTLDAESVQCCVTSPPYWGLRDYGVPGQLGLERTPEEYVANLVERFAEVRRVLKADGVVWLNLGDCYATGGGKVGVCPGGGEQGARWMGLTGRDDGRPQTNGRGEPQVPRLRDDSRGRGTPSRADGSAGAVEYYGPRQQPNRLPLPGLKPKNLVGIPWRDAANNFVRPERISHGEGSSKPYQSNGTRNRRTVWRVASQPFDGAHFATFPPALIEPCILAGSRIGDTILDPFGGAGTTGLVADRLGRDSILVELNPAYAELARRRLTDDAPLFVEVTA